MRSLSKPQSFERASFLGSRPSPAEAVNVAFGGNRRRQRARTMSPPRTGLVPHEDALGLVPHEDALGLVPHEDVTSCETVG